ncbi:MAG: NTP transferase domain-containing protein [Methanomicrobiales archaeon]|nr:NTP transferase domain-containing protein [Methanomicrobiales archaeon]
MLALILAGGGGSRLKMGEKPMVNVRGSPMIARVTGAFQSAGLEVVVALTERVPYTANWCRAHSIPFVVTEGRGYIEDLVEAVMTLEEEGPLFTSVVDIPCLTPKTVEVIRNVYRVAGTDALSTWVPCRLIHGAGCIPRYVEVVDGISAGAAGINVLRGELIGSYQDELRFLIDEPELAFNVNTRRELACAERYLTLHQPG